jgi:hypothetical protein
MNDRNNIDNNNCNPFIKRIKIKIWKYQAFLQ